MGLFIPALVALSVGFQIAGRKKQAEAGRRAARANADFFRIQKAQIAKAGLREEEIFRERADAVIGSQVSAFARGGVDIAGSPILAIGETQRRAIAQIADIRTETEFRVKQAQARVEGADQEARDIQSSLSLGLASDLLTGGARFAQAGFGGGS